MIRLTWGISDEIRIRPWPGNTRWWVSELGFIGKIWLGASRNPAPCVGQAYKRGPKAIHVMVLEAFVGPRPAGMECRHLNGIPTDNRVENLAWGTKKENQADLRRHKREFPERYTARGGPTTRGRKRYPQKKKYVDHRKPRKGMAFFIWATRENGTRFKQFTMDWERADGQMRATRTRGV